jgi:hypothetical protein
MSRDGFNPYGCGPEPIAPRVLGQAADDTVALSSETDVPAAAALREAVDKAYQDACRMGVGAYRIDGDGRATYVDLWS